MSYWFRMYFIELKDGEDPLLLSVKISELMYQDGFEIIKNNSASIPSICIGNTDLHALDNVEFRKAWKYTDEYWLYALFTCKFIFWNEHNLLGIQGNLSQNIIDKYRLKEIQFQNSCDQDYEYKEWLGISCFEDVIQRYEDATKEELSTRFDWLGDKHDELDLEYYRRSAVYQEIYEKLDLCNWLYGKKGNFLLYCLQSIKSLEDRLTLFQHLMICRKEIIEA